MDHQSIFSSKNLTTWRKISISIFTNLLIATFLFSNGFAGPPIFHPIGEERYMNSNLFVVEGNEVEFTVSAKDPDGDPLTYSALNVPDWANFNSSTGVFSGIAPLWADDFETRENQRNVFDVTFEVTDGTFTTRKVVSIYVLDSRWTYKTVAELIANRPITAGGEIGTPVEITDVHDEIIQSSYGGGKRLRKITFSFTSQVPDIPGWEDDWASTINYVFLPLNTPAAQNVGAIIEGSYAQEFGESQLAERACAELDIPVLIIDRSWDWGHGSELMSKYDSLAVEKRDPEYLFYTFSTAHYLRSIDALITVIDSLTNWQVSYTDFKVVFTGHSKFGHTCHNAAAADPNRVVGFMANGSSIIDTGASRLLGSIQGAQGTKPEAFVHYLAVMMRYYIESLKIESQMNSDVQALITQGTDDDKDRSSGYTPKYIQLTADKQVAVPHAIGCLPNAPHTTQTPLHSTYWIMWLAHCFLERPITQIDSVFHYSNGSNIIVEAKITSDATIHKVFVWATDQSDLDTSSWNGFSSYPMSLSGGVYKGEIPGNSNTYFIEVKDEANGVRGLIASPPVPVDKDYPIIPQSPGDIKNFQAEVNQSNVALSWENPVDADLAGLVIRYSTTGYPSSPVDGILVYDGNGTAVTHYISNENTIYYAAFTYDSQGNYSNGATLKIEGTTDVDDNDKSMPDHFKLLQNYPNPFNSTTTISFVLPEPVALKLNIYDVNGRLVKSYAEGEIWSAGEHTVRWNGTGNSGREVGSGVYLFKLDTEKFQDVKKLLFLK